MPVLLQLALGAGWRFVNANLLVACAIAAAATAVPVVLVWWHHDATSAAVSDRDRTWTSKLAKSKAAIDAKHRLQAAAADAAAEAERAKLREERDVAAQRADALEAVLRNLRRPDGRLIIYPAPLVEELRK